MGADPARDQAQEIGLIQNGGPSSPGRDMGSAAAFEDEGALGEASKRRASLSCHYQMERRGG